MINFLKGIIVGLGGVAPGLSGSVLLIIFGLYQKTLEALATLFKDFKKNIQFLLPLLLGMGVGVLLFSKILNYFLTNHEVPTRFAFLGLIVGTVPLFYREVKKEGFSNKYYILISLSALFGFFLFTFNPNNFQQVTNPTLFQSILLGVAVAATAIIPGVDPAVLLSTLGFYEMYVESLASVNLQVLLPMVVGLAIGAVLISFIMTYLLKHFYTISYSIIFGIFLTMIPNMLTENCLLGFNTTSIISIVVMILGFAISYYLGDIEGNNQKIKQILNK